MSESFAGLGLCAEVVRAVSEEGYTDPTPVQVQAIPVVLQGRDVLAGAQTGTGKTAGFTLPMLQLLAAEAPTGPRPPRALVLTPTRELAGQVEESIRTYGKYLPLTSTLLYGGVGMTPQVEALARGCDILVATPGRLLDHAQQGSCDLSKIEILVLDEADRMLDMGFIRDIRRVLELLPGERQNLLFSATFSDEIRALAGDLLHDPVHVEVARRNAESELVTQRVHPVDPGRKRELLAHLVSSHDWRQVLVFTRTKHGANRLAQQLAKRGIEADAIHGNRSQPQRLKALAGFKAGTIRVLVATDIAARGLDIEELPHVINYDLPNVPEDYVHRIGRTGRAGSEGEAISLVAPDDLPLLTDIEKLLGRKLEREIVPGFEPGSAPTEAVAVETDDEGASDEAAAERPPVRVDGAGQNSGRNGTNRNRNNRDRERTPRQSNAESRDNRGNAESRDNRGNAESRDNRGNTMGGGKGRNNPRNDSFQGPAGDPPPPAALFNPHDDDRTDVYDERQPTSNASALFPSSGRVFGEPRMPSHNRGGGGGGGKYRQGGDAYRGNGGNGGNGNGGGNGNRAGAAGNRSGGGPNAAGGGNRPAQGGKRRGGKRPASTVGAPRRAGG